jgi:hypothetical protein
MEPESASDPERLCNFPSRESVRLLISCSLRHAPDDAPSAAVPNDRMLGSTTCDAIQTSNTPRPKSAASARASRRDTAPAAFECTTASIVASLLSSHRAQPPAQPFGSWNSEATNFPPCTPFFPYMGPLPSLGIFFYEATRRSHRDNGKPLTPTRGKLRWGPFG